MSRADDAAARAEALAAIRVQFHKNAQADGGIFRPDLNDCQFCGANALVYVFGDADPKYTPRFQCFGCGQNGRALDVAGDDCDGRPVRAVLRHADDVTTHWQARAGMAEARVAAVEVERDRLLAERASR